MSLLEISWPKGHHKALDCLDMALLFVRLLVWIISVWLHFIPQVYNPCSKQGHARYWKIAIFHWTKSGTKSETWRCCGKAMRCSWYIEITSASGKEFMGPRILQSDRMSRRIMFGPSLGQPASCTQQERDSRTWVLPVTRWEFPRRWPLECRLIYLVITWWHLNWSNVIRTTRLVIVTY